MRLALIALVFVTACQRYDFEPVTPIAISQTTESRTIVARRLKPNLMLLVDKSGSMNDVIQRLPECGTCRGDSCPANCPTRISELKSAMGQFLSTSSTVARMGLTVFPTDQTCGPSNEVLVPLPAPTTTDADNAPLTAAATAINTQLQALRQASTNPKLKVEGGTPTGGSLSFFLGSAANTQGLFEEDNRQDFILLLTDGLPNCNPTNTVNCNNMPAPAANLCTNANCQGNFCYNGYLDKEGVVQSITRLRSRNVSTIVVGFGADFAQPEALDVLNTMASAGGFGRTCKNGTDAECGSTAQSPNRCINNLCQKQFYAAANAVDLSRALSEIQNIIGMEDPCNFPLADRPTDDRFLAVIVDGQTTPKGVATWSMTSTGAVQFVGSICDRIKASTPVAPVSVEFRIVSTL